MRDMKQGWESHKFADVFDLQMGKTPSRDDSSYWNGDNVWVSIADLNDKKYISESKEGITDKAVKESGIKIVPKNTVIMSFKLSIGKTAITTTPLFTNEAIMAFIEKEKDILIPEYIYYYLKGYKWAGANKAVLGMTLNKKSISEQIFSYPPLPEQEKIVSELDCLSGIIEKKHRQLKELDALAQSIFYEMFGDPVENEKGWECMLLKDVCDKIGDGLHGTPQYDENGLIPFINGTNLENGRIRITDRTQYVNEIEAQKFHIEMNDSTVLLSINGTLGKTALYKGENVILGKSVCYCNLKEMILTTFVMALMQTTAFKQFLEDNSSKSTIKNVGLKAIRGFGIILPPLPLQQTFASKIEAIEKQKALIKQSLGEVETLFNSRMDFYFN